MHTYTNQEYWHSTEQADAVCLYTKVVPVIGFKFILNSNPYPNRLWVSALRLWVKTVLMLSPSEWFDSSMLFSFAPSIFTLCPVQHVDPGQHRRRKIYLFIIAAASQQWPSTKKPLGGDWVPDPFDSKLLCWTKEFDCSCMTAVLGSNVIFLPLRRIRDLLRQEIIEVYSKTNIIQMEEKWGTLSTLLKQLYMCLLLLSWVKGVSRHAVTVRRCSLNVAEVLRGVMQSRF